MLHHISISNTLLKTAQSCDKLCPTFQGMCNILNEMTDWGFYPETNYLCLLLTRRSSSLLGYVDLGGISLLKKEVYHCCLQQMQIFGGCVPDIYVPSPRNHFEQWWIMILDAWYSIVCATTGILLHIDFLISCTPPSPPGRLVISHSEI